MSSKPDISVIVTVYNQAFPSVILTLDSIVRQKNVDFEIVIADDCSRHDYAAELEEYFSAQSFDGYTYVRHDANYKTVGNLLHALDHCRGRYVKEIGTGDALFDEHVLHDIVRFCNDRGVEIGFGSMRQYNNEGESLAVGEYNAPKNAHSYESESHKELFRHQLSLADWIPAPAQFYTTQRYKQLLDRLYNEFGVRYCEDFTATIALEEQTIPYLDRPLIWYEFGVGISTTGGKESVRRLYRDHESFYQTELKLHPNSSFYKSALRAFKLRKFIAVDTPFYSFFQNRLANQYQKEQDGNVVANDMLLSCLRAKNEAEA